MSAMAWMAKQIEQIEPGGPEIIYSPAIREVVELARKHGQINSRLVANARGMKYVREANKLLQLAHEHGLLRRIEPDSRNLAVQYTPVHRVGK